MQNKTSSRSKSGKAPAGKQGGRGGTTLTRLGSVLEELDSFDEVIMEDDDLALESVLEKADEREDRIREAAKKKRKTGHGKPGIPQKRKAQVRRRIREWKEMGFDTGRLNDIFESEAQVVTRILQSFDRDVKTLQRAAHRIREIGKISCAGEDIFAERIKSISGKLKDPESVVEILTELSELESLITFKQNSLI